MKLSKEQKSRLGRIKLLGMDVDGVLSEGYLIWQANGQEIKRFHVHDGWGLAMASKAGIKLALLTARRSKVTAIRARTLHITDVLVSRVDKLKLYKSLKKKYRLKDEEIAYMGDDWLDIPVIRECGFGVAVKNARPEVKKVADYVTKITGGHGAVREIVEMILAAQGKLKVPK